MDRVIYGANWYVDTLNQRLRLDTVQLPNLSRVNDTVSWPVAGWHLRTPGRSSR